MTVTGLTEREAARRLAAEGRNELLAAPPLGWLTALARQVRELIILVLLAAAVVTAVVGDLADTAVIMTVVVLNCTLGALQEVRSGRAIDALADLTAPRATVIRDGRSRDIDVGEVVRGDVIRLSAGDIVPSDARLILAEAVQSDESMLTGENEPVPKGSSALVYAGTVITHGRGEAVVTATAEATAMGAIARSVRDTGQTQTPVQKQLAVLGKRLAWAAAAAAAGVATLNMIGGQSLETSLVLAVSLAVAAIPESLPAVVTLSLAMAARRMTSHGVLVKKLSAVEALGSVTIIATDKTGTLTTGRMSFAQAWTAHPDNADELRALLESAVLCNDATAVTEGSADGRTQRDDPTEVALIEAAASSGIDVPAVRAAYPRISEIPFDPITARMTTVHDVGGIRREICKGAPEAVLAEMATAPGADEAAADLADHGQRVLAVACRRGRGPWRLLGLLGLVDPPRSQAAGMISAFRRAGVQPIMITGDHPRTALAIAGQVGLARSDRPEIVIADHLSDRGHSPVYARVRPKGKTAIVTGLQSRGQIVAMTGDGVNDAPALRAADIGVAMGKRGTQVAQQAADIVLTTDDLSAMVPAIGEGRRAYDNLRRFLHYGLSGGVAEVLIMLLGPLVGFPVPLLSGQILWINLLTHGLPGVAMGNEPAAPDVLTRAPRPTGQQLLDGPTARKVAALGFIITVLCLLAGLYARASDRPWQSTIFLALVLAQLAVALAIRPRSKGPSRNWSLDAAIALNTLLALLAVWWQPLRDLLRTDLLSPRDLVPCLAVAILAAAVARWQTRLRTGPARAGADGT